MNKVDNVLTNELCALQVGGLDSVVSDASGGWKNIVVRIAPTAIVTVGGASNRHETRFGTVSLSWRYKDGQLTMYTRDVQAHLSAYPLTRAEATVLLRSSTNLQ